MRTSTVRALLPALAVFVLVAVVAIAARGSTPVGSWDSRPPAGVLIDTIVSLGMVALVPAAAMLAYGLVQRKAIAREIASGRYRRTSYLGFVLLLTLFTLAAYLRLRDWKRVPIEDEIGERGFSDPGARPNGISRGMDGARETEFAWIPVLVVLGLVAIVVGAYVLADRRRQRALPAGEAQMAEDVADVLEESLDDLRAEPDPRRAVIAVYARLERALAASGLPRLTHETAEEYVSRILGRLEVDTRLIRRLTELFTRAKFSQHAVDEAMKQEAILALEQVRDELRAAARRRTEGVGGQRTRHERTVTS